MTTDSRALSWRRGSGLADAAVETARESLSSAAGEAERAVTQAGTDDADAFVLEADLALHPPYAGTTPPSPPLVALPPRAGNATSARKGLGVALGADADLRGDGWHEAVRDLGLDPTFVLVLDPSQAGSATDLLRGLARGRRADASSAASLATAIDGCALVVAFSTAAAVIAYARNVPFLLDRRAPAAAGFLEPRGLASWTFEDPAELATRARALLGLEIDLSPLVANDRRALVAWLAGSHPADREPFPLANAPVLRPSATEPLARDAADVSARRRLRAMVERLDHDLVRLHHEVASQRDRIDELAAEVDRQSGEIERRERLLREIVDSRAWRLVTSIRGLAAALRKRLGRRGES